MSNPAPIYALAGDGHARAESAAWAQFSASPDVASFHASWLAILCAQIQRVDAALLVLGQPGGGGFAAAAVWPDASRDVHYLAPVAERALKERRGVLTGADASAPPSRDQPARVGYPIEVDGALHGAVVLDLPAAAPADLQRAMRLLHWASAWLVDQVRRQAMAQQAQRLARMTAANELLATCLQAPRLGPSALALVNALAQRLGCERVSLGFEQDGGIVVQAMSHTATFDRRSDTVRHVAEAMEEALDLGVAVAHPPPPDAAEGAPAGATPDLLGGVAAAELAAQARRGALLSVPVQDAGRTIGVLTLERQAAQHFDADALALCHAVAVFAGPVFSLKRAQERSNWQRLSGQLAAARQAITGPGHPGAKLVSAVVLLAVLLLAFVQLPYRVSARTVIEGEVQRAAVAPFDGYLAQALVRAGDTVRAGQPLARLLDRDLRLEQQRWAADRALAERRWRQVAAVQDRASMAMAQAQVDQAQAQLSLVEEKLARAVLVAPFDGVVVQGDLSQMLGSPVEQGQVLFEIAPLDRYRVVLEVDERDIGPVAAGQRGALVVAGISNASLPFTVVQVTPISTARDGRNHFRVEARLEGPTTRLRPGMEGIGKVEVGERRLLWIWTHGLTDWLRLAWWRWSP